MPWRKTQALAFETGDLVCAGGFTHCLCVTMWPRRIGTNIFSHYLNIITECLLILAHSLENTTEGKKMKKVTLERNWSSLLMSVNWIQISPNFQMRAKMKLAEEQQ